MSPPFTAVVVIHDSGPELATLLDSLDRHLPEPPQLVAVDTGSRDRGAELAGERGAEVVSLPDNPGFGPAPSNAGFQAVNAPPSNPGFHPAAPQGFASGPMYPRAKAAAFSTE